MNIENILLIIIIIYLIISHFKKNIENFALSVDENEVKTLIDEIYNTNIDVIRNVSNLFKMIFKNDNNLDIYGNITIPGNLTIDGNINSNHIYTKTLDINSKYNLKTHFNYEDKGKTLIRDTFYVHDNVTKYDILAFDMW